MTDLADLERRIGRIEDVEAIKQVKYDYWHHIDLKRWGELGNCFTEDISAYYGRDDWRIEGRKELVDWLRGNEGGEHYSVSHAGHNPQVKLLGEDQAEGFFKLHDWVRIEPSITLRGWGHYENRFVRESDGQWRIKTLVLNYVYKEEHLIYTGNEPPQMTPAMK